MQGSRNQSVLSCDYRCVIPLTSASPLEAPVDDRSTLSEWETEWQPYLQNGSRVRYRETTIRAAGGNPDGEYTCIMRDCVKIYM